MENTNPILALLAPGDFFAAKKEDPVGLNIPALLVLITGLGGAGVAYLNSQIQNQLIGHTPTVLDPVLTLIVAILTAYLTWVIVTGIFAALSRVLYGGGEFLRLLQFTSYGFIPGFIGSVITIPVLAPFTGSLRLPALGDPQMIGAMVEQIQHTPTMQTAALIEMICLLWSGYIWIFGVREAEDLATRHAAIVVGIPVIIAVAVKVLGVL
ncbi:YIP1 family protein [Methanosphaerula subterraneus]|uniref:YIP1 family protein n=1 Tax=Methanosphaerula subterraneus TaxID=3350244 RepID=UPI003F84397C